VELIDFRRPARGFANALHLWLACHDRFERVVALIGRLTEHVDRHGPDEAAGVTAREIRRYFDDAMPRHHADEEEDLFPRVLRRARQARLKGETGKAARAIERLGAEHEALLALWPSMREQLDGIELRQSRTIDRGLIGRFVDSQIEHHRVEDQIICPLAQRLLTPGDLDDLGAALASRRGLVWSDLASAA
jgi:hemerythrin-like domain-containing protein